MTACDARARLIRLAAACPGERLDLAACRAAFVGLAVTEIASLRAQLSGPQVG